MMTQYIRNAWYVAAWSKEVGRQLLPRRILDAERAQAQP